MDGPLARRGERRNLHKILVSKPEGKRSLGDIGLFGSIILKWILKEK
jgi:hypothetical protein